MSRVRENRTPGSMGGSWRRSSLRQPIMAALGKPRDLSPASPTAATSPAPYPTILLNDPAGAAERLDPGTWNLGPQRRPADLVRQGAADIESAIDAGAASALIVMSQARMTGDAVLAMALGEYLVHGWDLAVSTGRSWEAADVAAEPALGFLHTTIAPGHRGPDSGFFDEEVTAPPEATAFERLLCFAGRHPDWAPSDSAT